MSFLKKSILSFIASLFIMANSTAQAQTISVASDATWPPFEVLDENKQVVGYAIDYINAVAKEAGLKTKVSNVAWDGIFAGLASGQYDVIASSVTITPERKKAMLFTEPYFENYQALIVPKNSSITSFADLSGKKVGGQIGTTGIFVLAKLSKDAIPQTYDDIALAIEDLKTGRIDAVISDEFVAYHYAEKHPTYANDLQIIAKGTTPEYYGFALNKNDKELLDKLNAGIKEVKASGQDKEIHKKWLQ